MTDASSALSFKLPRNINTHMITTPVNPEGQQQSSFVSSGFISNMLNPSPDTGIDSLFNLNTASTLLIDVPVITFAEPPLLSAITLPPPPTSLITHLQQTPVPTPPTVPSSSLQDLPNFGSLFGFDHRLENLEKQKLLKNLYKALVDAYESDKLILDTYGDTISFKRRRDDEDKDEEPFVRSNRGSKRRRARKELESTNEPKKKTSKTTGKSTEGRSNIQLMERSLQDLVELEFFFEEVYKATTDQLDWNNPKGKACVCEDDMTLCETRTDLASQVGQSCGRYYGTEGTGVRTRSWTKLIDEELLSIPGSDKDVLINFRDMYWCRVIEPPKSFALKSLEIMHREVKTLKGSKIPMCDKCDGIQGGPEFTLGTFFARLSKGLEFALHQVSKMYEELGRGVG
ncbi:hypothetical protein Tco_0385285 [Tanacetum coccineum]